MICKYYEEFPPPGEMHIIFTLYVRSISSGPCSAERAIHLQILWLQKSLHQTIHWLFLSKVIHLCNESDTEPASSALPAATHSSLKDGTEGTSILIFHPQVIHPWTSSFPGTPASEMLIKLHKLFFLDSGCLRVGAKARPPVLRRLSICPQFPGLCLWNVNPGFSGLAVCLPNTRPLQLEEAVVPMVRNMGSGEMLPF